MAEDEPQIIRPPDTLRSKVTEGGPGAVDLAALERAEEVIASLTDNYLEWVQEDLAKLQKTYDDLAAKTDDEGRKEGAEAVFQIAHDIKGQGGSFGYDLMTVIGNSLCRFIEKSDEIGPKHVQVVKVHVDSLKLVIAEGMEGDGGAAGEQLLKGLDLVVQKIMGG